MGEDVALHVGRRAVARELEQALLVVDDEQDRVVLVDALVLEAGFLRVLVISVRTVCRSRERGHTVHGAEDAAERVLVE